MYDNPTLRLTQTEVAISPTIHEADLYINNGGADTDAIIESLCD